MLSSYLKKQKGYALVVILMMFLILAVLSATLLSLWYFDSVMAQKKICKLQAYYIARSAADAMGTHLLKNNDDIPEIIGLKSDENTFFGEDTNFTVSVSKQGSKILIQGRAAVEGVTDTANLILRENINYITKPDESLEVYYTYTREGWVKEP